MSQQSSKQPTLDGVALSVSRKVRQVSAEWAYVLRREPTKRSNEDSGNTGTDLAARAHRTPYGSEKLDKDPQLIHQLGCGGKVHRTKLGYIAVCETCRKLFL